METAQQAHKSAVAAVQEAEGELSPARRAPAEAERAVAAARDTAERLAREQTRREARAQTLDETAARLETEAGEAQDTLDREAAGENTGGGDELQVELDAARARAEAARSDAAQARLERDAEARERVGREQRLAASKRDRADWERRAKISADHVDVLSNDRQRTAGALERARATPGEIRARREQLLDGFNQAEARRRDSADALAEGEKLASDSDKAARAADHAASNAREQRARPPSPVTKARPSASPKLTPRFAKPRTCRRKNSARD